MRLLRPTIRARLTGAAIAVTIVMLAVASFVIVGIQRRAMTEGIDDAVRQRADNLELLRSIPQLPGEGDPEDSFAQLLDRNGSVLAASGNIPTLAIIDGSDPNRWTARIRTVKLDAPVPGHYRVLTRPIDVGNERALLVVGKNLDDVSDSVHVLALTLLGVAPVLALLLGLVAWSLIGRTLRPVEAIRREVAGIDGDALHRRVPVPATDDEVAELARTMNKMLARVEAASERQQQFVDDASHELRTPLTRMVADLDIALAHPDREAPSVVFERLLEDATDLRRLLQDLLFLARSEREGLQVHDTVDLDDIALRVSRDVRERSELDVDTTGVAAARAFGDGRALERAVSNLMDNAVRHARTRIAIATAAANGCSVLTVDDDGCGIAPLDRERIFERFTRLDEARSRADGGAGLGLAIVRDIATRHRGSVTVSDSPAGGARFVLSLPGEPETSDGIV